MAKKNGSPFDAIAKKDAPKTASKTTKLAATTTPAIEDAVDIFIAHKAEIKRLEAEQEQAQATVVAHVQPQQDAEARKGNFSKSFLVKGKSGDVTYNTSDRFSLPKDAESQEALKELLGEEKFDSWFETIRTITLKESAQTNEVFIKKLTAAVEAAGMSMGDAFDVTDTLKAKDDLDRKQFELSPEDLATFRTLAKQNRPALK